MGPFQGMVTIVCMPDLRTQEFIRGRGAGKEGAPGVAPKTQATHAVCKDEGKESLECPFTQSIKKIRCF